MKNMKNKEINEIDIEDLESPEVNSGSSRSEERRVGKEC